MVLLHRLNEKCPGILQVSDHDHRHNCTSKLNPSVSHVYAPNEVEVSVAKPHLIFSLVNENPKSCTVFNFNFACNVLSYQYTSFDGDGSAVSLPMLAPGTEPTTLGM